MANMEVDGLNELAKTLSKLYNFTDEYGTELLTEGGNIIAKNIKNSAARYGHSRTGRMIRNIQLKRKLSEDKYGTKFVTVEAPGTEPRGKKKPRTMSNAQKAFWANYGTSKQAGTRFWNKGEQAADKEMQTVFERKIEQTYLEKGIK